MFFVSALNAQEISDKSNTLEIKLQKDISYFPSNYGLSGNTFGGEIIYKINAQRKDRDWTKSLNIKSIDIIFDYRNTKKILTKGQDYTFGDSYALLSGITISLLKNKYVELGFSPSFGVGYSDETFFTNGNKILGSKINLYSVATFNVDVPVSSSTSIGLNVGVLHYSNAATRIPNNGMNMGIAGINFKRKLPYSATEEKNNTHIQPKKIKRHNVEIAANIGRRGVYGSRKGLYKTGLYTGYNYKINQYIGIGAGIDGIYYHSLYDSKRHGETYQSKATSYDRWRVGAAIGPDIWLGNLGIMFKYGQYLHFNSFNDINNYWTVGMRYNIIHGIGVHAKGYIHTSEIDCLGLGVNFTF